MAPTKHSSTSLYTAAAAAITFITFPVSGVSGNGYFCGESWIDAIAKCTTACPSGAPSVCPGDESCFAGTPCVATPQAPKPAPTNPPTPPPVAVSESENVNVPVSGPPPPSTGGAAPSVYGTCGNGSLGNGICPDNNECCSQYGFCGTTLQHCLNKAGNLGPDYKDDPLGSQTVGGGNPNFGPQNQPLESSPVGGGNSPIADESATNNGIDDPKPSSVAPHGTNKKIIGYYAGWQWYDRDKLAKPANIDFSKMQRVNYAFFQPDVEGNIFGTDRWGDPQLLWGPYSQQTVEGEQKCSWDTPFEKNCAYHQYNSGLIYYAHAAGATVYPSIGGWTLSDHFPTLSANEGSRIAFAKNCAELVMYYGFDGIDIDWEYPGYEDHSGTSADVINFTKMLASIRMELDRLSLATNKHYGLTAALPCNPDNIKNIEVANIVPLLSEFNLMSYDFHGAWDATTGVNAPLYPQEHGNAEFSTHRCVENFVKLGVPREKINIGLPFYGRSFKYANGLNQPHGGSDTTNWGEDDGSPQYFNIVKKLPDMIQIRDNRSKTQYAFISHKNPTGAQSLATSTHPDGLVSFDDERAICDKVEYAQQNDLSGFIIWELSGDLMDDLSTPLLDTINGKLAQPNFQCCRIHSMEECVKEAESEQYQSSSMGASVNRENERDSSPASGLVASFYLPCSFLFGYFLLRMCVY